MPKLTSLLSEEFGAVLVIELPVVHAVHDGHQPLEPGHRLLLGPFAQEVLKGNRESLFRTLIFMAAVVAQR